MKVLTDYKQLEGKTIAFAHMAQFADQITLVTTDDEVLMATFTQEYEDEFEIKVFNKYNVIYAINNDKYIREEFSKLGIFDLEEWKEEQEKKQRLERQNLKMIREMREREQYEKLKAKFESSK
ncbi:hypothetical protein [Siminovitchia fordii]|uniref:Uncharacterized protein n=1 Tax=Siminovitchia fordii TaxID=254759 RepID=A0ABQ4KBP7_9BACI|nr:hypothetical protein [Siminovitchia fordii]GIN22563.1 hypothetical protein J1TS3_36970 [Siminovitchia fordii]